jgi:hypothetical protein
VLPFDEAAAVHCAEIVAARRREDRSIEALDAQIAEGSATPSLGTMAKLQNLTTTTLPENSHGN